MDGIELNRIYRDIGLCNACPLRDNGRALPDWEVHSKYALVAEAPGREETIKEIPLVGEAGIKLWDVMAEFNLYRKDFGIINTVQCRPMNGNRNGKPTLMEMAECEKYVRRFIEYLDPIKILLMGNYAKWYFDGFIGGITPMNGAIGTSFNKPTVLSVHPAVAIYEGEKGIDKLRFAIAEFVKLGNDKSSMHKQNLQTLL